jgi:hypothetical protein
MKFFERQSWNKKSVMGTKIILVKKSVMGSMIYNGVLDQSPTSTPNFL